MNILSFLRLNALFLSAGFLLTFGSAFGQTFFISIFAGDIRAEFGLSHAAWGGIYSLGTTTSAIVMVWAGGLTDVFRIRTLGTIVISMLVIACLTMAWAPAPWALVVAIFLLRLSGQGMMSHLGAVSMARWFVAARGRALSIAGLGFSAAEVTLPVIFVALLALYDWRLLWVACAGIAFLYFPLLSWLLRAERTPQSIATDTQAFGMGGRFWTRREVLTHRLFWFMIPALLGPAAFNTAFFFQQVHFTEIKGWSHLQFVALFPVYTIVGTSTMLLSGFLIDKFGTARMIAIYQLPMVIAFLVFSVAQTPLHAAVGFVFLGITSGANSTLPSAFWAEFYGTRYLGSIKAMAAAVMVFGSAIGPGLTGFLITAGVSWETQMIGVAAYFLFTCISVGIGIAVARKDLPVAA